jgi:hypothetical protein
MQKRLWGVCCLFLGCLALLGAPALAAQNSPTPTVMATYYRCVQGDVARADAIFKEHVTPFLKSEQAAGRIIAFGWQKHWSGGDWRRLFYVTGTDPDKLLDSYMALIKMGQSPEHAKAMDEFDRICSSHDDYTWRPVAASQSAADIGRVRSPYAMSTYYICNSHENEADFIVKTVFAPILNQRVKDGKIASWIWQEHLMGGKYRRMLVVDGASVKALMQNWASLQTDLEKANKDLSNRFTEICDSHSDYIWETGTE